MVRMRALAFALLLAWMAFGCTTTSEPEPVPEPVVETPVVEPEPVVKPAPEPVLVAAPKPAPPPQLPKTASVMPLVGLSGLVAIGLGGVLRTLRRR